MTYYLSVFLETVTAAVSVLIVSVYLKGFFEFSTPTGWRYGAYAIFFAILAALCLFAPYPTLLISFTLIAVFLVSVFFYTGNISRKLFASIVFCGLMAVSEIACAGIITFLSSAEFNATRSFNDGRILGIVLSKFVQMLIVKLIGFHVQRKRALSSISFKWLCPLLLGQLFLMMLTHYVLTTSMINHDALTPLPVIITIGILFLNLILFWYFDSVTAMFEYKVMSAAAGVHLEQQMKYYTLILQRHSELDSHWHDFNKHIAVIQELKRSANSAEAHEYIDELERSYTKMPGIVRTPHSTINAVLTYNLERCREIGIKTELDVRLPSAITVNPIELCIVLGNIFENAIEACEVLPESSTKSITLTICKLNNVLLIEIANPYNQHVRKAKQGAQGLGLRNVKSVVEKYKGDMTINAKDGVFSISIILP